MKQARDGPAGALCGQNDDRVTGFNHIIPMGNHCLLALYDGGDQGSPWDGHALDGQACGSATGRCDHLKYFSLSALQHSQALEFALPGVPENVMAL